MKSIGKFAFYGCNSLTSITLPFVGSSKTASGYDQVFGYIFGYDTTSSSASSISGATYQYDGDTAYYHYYIPSSIESVTIIGGKIPYHSFYNCSKVTNVTIGDSLTSIGSDAFYNCSSLTSIYYTGNVASWCEISGLGNLMSNSRTLYIDDKIVEGNLVIPDNVTSIKDYAFRGCSGLTNVIIPDNVTSIGEAVFKDCTSLESITIPFVGSSKTASGFAQVFGYIFGYTTTSSSLSISGATYQYSTKDHNFHYYIPSSIKSVTITGGKIPYHAFYNCSGLTSVTIPNSVTSIGAYAFSYCRSLTNITIPDSVTSISDYAFQYCTGLTSVTIGKGVTAIGGSSFEYCKGLKTVFYAGTEEEWKAVAIGSYNTSFTNATKYYYSEERPTTTGNYWHYDEDGVTPVIWD